MIKLVPAYMEQLVSYCRVKILINLRNFAGLEEFRCLYGSVPLYKNNEKMSRMKKNC